MLVFVNEEGMMSVRCVLYLLVIINCYRNTSAVAIGGFCLKTEECEPQNLTACIGGVCSCITGYVPSSKPLGCIPTVKHGETCEESVQCSYSKETICRSGICQCKTNLNFNGKRCVGNLPLGAACDHDYECVVDYDLKQETVWCFSGLCNCRLGFRTQEARCVIGGDCKDDKGCEKLENSFCNTLKRDRYHCACQDGYIPAANNTKCLQVVYELGRGCEYDEQCSDKLGETVCIKHQCQCREGASLNENKTCSAAVGSMISLSCFLLVLLVKLI